MREIFSIGRTCLQFCSTVIRTFIKRFFSTWADHFIFQTQSSLDTFSYRFRIRKHLHLLPNAYDNNFLTYDLDTNPQSYSSLQVDIFNTPDLKDTLINSRNALTFKNLLLTLSANTNVKVVLIPGADYAHKGYFLLPNIIDEFAKLVDSSSDKYVFVLTLPVASKSCLSLFSNLSNLYFSDNVSIANIGPYDYKEIPEIMQSVSLCFLPSLLEVFSASYLEALVFKKPLVVANTPFALDICGNAAMYINPRNAKSTAISLYCLLHSQSLQQQLALHSLPRLTSFPSHEERYLTFKDFL